MVDMISRQAALEVMARLEPSFKGSVLEQAVKNLPAVQPELKESAWKTDCVNLSERVTATYYDDEYEEWSQKTVTIRDVLDSVCENYTVI